LSRFKTFICFNGISIEFTDIVFNHEGFVFTKFIQYSLRSELDEAACLKAKSGF